MNLIDFVLINRNKNFLGMDSLEKDIAPTVVLYLFGIRDIMLYIFFSADSISGDKKELGVRKIVVSYKT